MRKHLTTALEVGSAGAVSLGAFLWAPAAGWAVAGLFGLAFARGVAR